MTSVAQLHKAAEILETMGGSLAELRRSRHIWTHIEQPLSRYHEFGVIRQWHVDSALIGCRRLTDTDKSSGGLTLALEKIRDGATHLTADTLLDVRIISLQRRGDPPFEDPLDVKIHLDELAQMSTTAGHLDPAYPAADIETITDVGDEVITYVNRRIAHRDRRAAVSPEWAQVDALITKIVAVFERWLPMLVAKGFSTHPPKPQLALTTAMELFDWREYNVAQSEFERAAGWQDSRPVKSRVRYEFWHEGTEPPP